MSTAPDLRQADSRPMRPQPVLDRHTLVYLLQNSKLGKLWAVAIVAAPPSQHLGFDLLAMTAMEIHIRELVRHLRQLVTMKTMEKSQTTLQLPSARTMPRLSSVQSIPCLKVQG